MVKFRDVVVKPELVLSYASHAASHALTNIPNIQTSSASNIIILPSQSSKIITQKEV